MKVIYSDATKSEEKKSPHCFMFMIQFGNNRLHEKRNAQLYLSGDNGYNDYGFLQNIRILASKPTADEQNPVNRRAFPSQ